MDARKPENWKPSERKMWDLYESIEKPKAADVIDYIKMTVLGRPYSPNLDSIVML